MDIVLPRELAYSPSLPALPECTSIEIVASPVNGSTFGAGQLIQFDLVSKGYLDPSSLYLRYTYTIAGGTGSATIRGTPVYSFFQKFETIVGSSIVESINDYNQVCNMWTQLQMNVADKYGIASSYGWNNTDLAWGLFDGRACSSATETGSFAAPIPCMFSLAEKLIPLGMMPNCRLQLTTESCANMFFAGATLPTSYTLKNVELCYTMIDFTHQVNDIVQNMGDIFYIKSTSFQSMSQYLPVGSSGTNDLIYNCRLASIKSLFTHFCDGSSTRSVNGKFESIDITNKAGEMVYSVAGVQYPSRPLSTLNNKSGFIMELKKAVGALHKNNFSFSINADEFNVLDSALAGTPTTQGNSSKFWFGVNCEKLSSSNVLLSGISTQSSPITLRLSLPNALVGGYSVVLNALYDCLIEIDPHNKQCTVKQ